jgi:hypothetical protein
MTMTCPTLQVQPIWPTEKPTTHRNTQAKKFSIWSKLQTLNTHTEPLRKPDTNSCRTKCSEQEVKLCCCSKSSVQPGHCNSSRRNSLKASIYAGWRMSVEHPLKPSHSRNYKIQHASSRTQGHISINLYHLCVMNVRQVGQSNHTAFKCCNAIL